MIPDAHVTPNTNLRRFTWLANLIEDRRPDLIVQLGDFATMESLSHWDQNKRLLIEGRRIKEDLEEARMAWDTVEAVITRIQYLQRRQKTKLYQPELIWFEGNHEDWLRQWTERNPEMEGMIDLQTELGITTRLYSKFDWVPWKESRVDEGILYCHVPIGRTGPISSKYITARAIADYSNISCIFGHTHRRQDDSIARITRDGELTTIRAVNVGCFFEEWPHYALGNSNDYWQGLTILNVYAPGLFDVEEWGMARLERIYG